MKMQMLFPEPLVVAGTGHRPDNRRSWRGVGDWNNARLHAGVATWLGEQLDELKPAKVISGMALGVDTWLAQEALKRRIHLIAAVPFEGQERTWPEEHQRVYHAILKQAEVVNVNGYRVVDGKACFAWLDSQLPGVPIGESRGTQLLKATMQRRNEWMVDMCHSLLSVWDGTPGGTGNCMRYAQRVDREYRRLNPNTQR